MTKHMQTLGTMPGTKSYLLLLMFLLLQTHSQHNSKKALHIKLCSHIQRKRPSAWKPKL